MEAHQNLCSQPKLEYFPADRSVKPPKRLCFGLQLNAPPMKMIVNPPTPPGSSSFICLGYPKKLRLPPKEDQRARINPWLHGPDRRMIVNGTVEHMLKFADTVWASIDPSSVLFPAPERGSQRPILEGIMGCPLRSFFDSLQLALRFTFLSLQQG